MWRQFALIVALVAPCGDTAVTANHTRTHSLAVRSGPRAVSSYCVFALHPESRKFKAAGDNKSVKVETSAKCPWTASASVGWIKLSTTSGVGNGTVRYTVERNTGAAREGTITIGGPTHRIEQEGAPPVRVK